MLHFDNIPNGITIQRMDKEWKCWMDNKNRKNVYNLLFHLVGLFYILFVETLLILDFIEHWKENCSNWLLVFFYVMQDLLFLWIVKEMVQSIRLLLERQKRVLCLQLQEKGFGVFLQDHHFNTLQEQWYTAKQLHAIYYNRGPQQRGTDTLAGLLNIPYELYLVSDSHSIDSWGRFLTVEQLYFLTYLLQDVYKDGRELGEVLG